MPAESEKIRAQLLYVNLHVRGALGAIHYTNRAHAVRLVRNTPHVVHQAQHVGYLGYSNNFSFLRYFCLYIVFGKVSILFQIHIFQFCASLPGHPLPGYKVAVMLRDRDHDFIAGLYKVQAITVRNKVQSLCGIFGENDFLRPGGMYEPLYPRPGLFVNFRSFHAEFVGAPVGIGIAASVIPAKRPHHMFRFLGRCTVVQIH